MADPRFFTNAGPFSLSEILKISGASCDATDGSFEDVAPLDQAEPGHVSFLDNVKYKDQFRTTKAGAVFVDAGMAEHTPNGVLALVSDNPYKAYALTAQAFYPDQEATGNIAKTAVIHDTAKIGKNCTIEDCAVIGAHVEIGDYCRIGPHSSISHAIIGNHVRLYPGVRVGQDGFGFAPDPAGFVKVPQLGRVIIEDHVEIGANTTIDRGAGPDTVIGQGSWIDNLVQIGHNVKIGRGCVLVAQVGISGSTVIEDYVMIAGQSGVAGHLRVGKGAKIGAQSGVMRDVPPGEQYLGAPAIPAKEFMRQVASLKRLIQNKKTA